MTMNQGKGKTIPTRAIRDVIEARMMAWFLWHERERHIKDIRKINKDLHHLKQRWGVVPERVDAFLMTDI